MALQNTPPLAQTRPQSLGTRLLCRPALGQIANPVANELADFLFMPRVDSTQEAMVMAFENACNSSPVDNIHADTDDHDPGSLSSRLLGPYSVNDGTHLADGCVQAGQNGLANQEMANVQLPDRPDPRHRPGCLEV